MILSGIRYTRLLKAADHVHRKTIKRENENDRIGTTMMVGLIGKDPPDQEELIINQFSGSSWPIKLNTSEGG